MKTLELPTLSGSRHQARPQLKRPSAELTPTRKTAAVGALLIGIGLTASWFLVLNPRAADVAEVKEQTAQAVSANDSLRSQIAARQAQAVQLPALSALSDALSSRFPPTAEQAALFKMIGAAAASAGIAPQYVTNLTVAAPTDGVGSAPSAALPGVATPIGMIASQQLTLDVRGKPDQIRKFVANLEKLPRAFQVNTLNLNIAAAAGGGGAGAGGAAAGAGGGAALAGGSTTAQLGGQMFLMPQFEAPPQPAVAPAPAPAS
jgi:Tfp pilus assembly protein PilO